MGGFLLFQQSPMPIKLTNRKGPTRFVAYVATSIDGRISRAFKKLPDWTSPEDKTFLSKSLAKADALIVGRNTYSAASKSLRKRKTFVLTSRVQNAVRRGLVTFINPANVAIKEQLTDFKTVAILGGGSAYCYMLENGLLDELFVTIEPLVFGNGQPMFAGGTKATRLSLESVRRLNGQGTLLIHYTINQ